MKVDQIFFFYFCGCTDSVKDSSCSKQLLSKITEELRIEPYINLHVYMIKMKEGRLVVTNQDVLLNGSTSKVNLKQEGQGQPIANFMFPHDQRE